MAGAQEQPMQVPMMGAGAQYQSNHSLEWMTQEDCCSDGGHGVRLNHQNRCTRYQTQGGV